MDSNNDNETKTEAERQDTVRGYVIGIFMSVIGISLWELFARLAWVNGSYTNTEPCQVLSPSYLDWGSDYRVPSSLVTSTCAVDKSIWNYAPHFLSPEWMQTQLIGFAAVAALALITKAVWWLIVETGPQLSYDITTVQEDTKAKN